MFLVYRRIYLWSHQHKQRLTKWWHYSLNYKLPITISSVELSSGTIPNCLFLVYISIFSSSFVLIDVLSYLCDDHFEADARSPIDQNLSLRALHI